MTLTKKEQKEVEDTETRQKRFRFFLICWMIAFTILVGLSLRSTQNLGKDNKKQIAELEQSKADIASLQKANCNIRNFLVTARNARLQTNGGNPTPTDVRAADGYKTILETYSDQAIGTNCKKIPLLPLPTH